ncbi:MAG: hypothetical protein ILA24_10255 [Ruminococcus sp.]|nr:hypothetical protein [Ruminococcus sp.]
MARIRRKNGRRRLLIMLVVVLLFAWYLAVGVIMSYMKISMLPKIFALTLPSFFMGVAVTLLVLDIRYGTHIRRRKRERSEAGGSTEEVEEEQQDDEDV